jgi:hypothetical protein
VEIRRFGSKGVASQLAELADYAAWVVVVALIVTIIVWVRLLTGMFGLLGKTIWRQ